MRYSYNHFDCLTMYQDRNNNKINYTYDTHGNLVSVSRTVSGQTEESVFQYDEYGQLMQSTDASNKTAVMTYDQHGNLLTVTDPENNTLSFTYDAVGRVLTKTDPRNGVWSYTYDNLGNVLTVTEPEAENSLSYT